jgi:hypothetical protein
MTSKPGDVLAQSDGAASSALRPAPFPVQLGLSWTRAVATRHARNSTVDEQRRFRSHSVRRAASAARDAEAGWRAQCVEVEGGGRSSWARSAARGSWTPTSRAREK